MILHRYLEAQYAVQAVENMDLKVSIPSKLNDPFEMLPREEKPWDRRSVKKYFADKQRFERFYQRYKKAQIFNNKKEFKAELKNESVLRSIVDHFNDDAFFWETVDRIDLLDSFLRIISFSSEYVSSGDDILLWAHYSKKHTGIRLSFDSEKLIYSNLLSLQKINYGVERHPVDFTREKDEYLSNQLRGALIKKAESWRYEKEFRLFVDLKLCVKKDDLYFTKFPPESLQEIHLGIWTDPKDLVKIQNLISIPEYSHVKLFKAQKDRYKFRINYRRIN